MKDYFGSDVTARGHLREDERGQQRHPQGDPQTDLPHSEDRTALQHLESGEAECSCVSGQT